MKTRILALGTLILLGAASHAAAQTYTCIRTGQATTTASPGILDLACTEDVTPDADYDIRVSADRGGNTYAWWRVVALSRPFGAIVIDARIECEDGTFYEESDASDPLAVGEAGGEVAFDIGQCAGSHEKITLTPRFPEWKCDGCGEYTPSR